MSVQATTPRRRLPLTLAGAAVAIVFLLPYVVMVLDSLCTSRDVKTTPPSFLPRVHRALQDPTISGERGFDVNLVKLAGLQENAGAVGAAGELFHGLKQKKLEALLGQSQEGRSDIKDFYRR